MSGWLPCSALVVLEVSGACVLCHGIQERGSVTVRRGGPSIAGAYDLALISPERIANRISSAVIFIHRSDGSQCTAARLVPLDGLGVVEQCRSGRWDVISARSLLTAQQAGEDGLCRAANRLTPA